MKKNYDDRDKEKAKKDQENIKIDEANSKNIIHSVKKVNKEIYLEDLNNLNYDVHMLIKQFLMDIENDIPYELVGNPKISIMESKGSEKYIIDDIADFFIELFSKEVLANNIIDESFISTYIVNIELKAEEKSIDHFVEAVHSYKYNIVIDVFQKDKSYTADNFIIEENVIVGLSQKGLNEVKATESLTIPMIDGVDTIGNSAFKVNKLDGANIKNIKILSPIKTIEEAAFKGNSIVSLKLNDELESIGDYSFQGNCLEFLELSKNVSTIGEGAFIPKIDYGIRNLKFNDKVTLIGEKAFYGNNISELNFPVSIKEISMSAFANNNNLQNICLDDGIEVIGKEAFSNTHLSGETVIPSSLVHLMDKSFENTKVDNLFIKGDESSNILQIHSNISPVLQNIRFENPNKKSYISYTASDNETGIKIDLGEVEVKADSSYIENLISKLDIYQSAYYIDLSDESGKSDKIITTDLLWDIDSLDLSKQFIIVKGIAEDFIGIEEIQGYKLPDFSNYIKQNDFNIILKFPEKEKWSAEDFIYSDQKITRLSDSGKQKIHTNKDLVLPNTNKEGEPILEIGSSAFIFKNIESLKLPERLEKVGMNAFSHNNISELLLPNTLLIIDEYAFSENNLAEVRLPDSLKDIKENSFIDNQGIVSLYSTNNMHRVFNSENSLNNHLIIIESEIN